MFYEAASVLAAFVLLGHWFEMRARGGANDAIRSLLDLAPPKAVVLRDGQPVEIPTAEVQVGDLLLVRPGAKIATDGIVEDGESEVDESVVTGESLPVHKQPGDQVIGATINKNGTLRVRATKVGSDTALAQIVKLGPGGPELQGARAAAGRPSGVLAGSGRPGRRRRSPSPLGRCSDRPLTDALLFAITVVVITCPDALGLATPTAIMVGTGLGAQRGILFKNAIALETSARIETVVMDKTGTLTKGEPEVTDSSWPTASTRRSCCAWSRRSSGSRSIRWPRPSSAAPSSWGRPEQPPPASRTCPGMGPSPTSTATGSRSATAG